MYGVSDTCIPKFIPIHFRWLVFPHLYGILYKFLFCIHSVSFCFTPQFLLYIHAPPTFWDYQIKIVGCLWYCTNQNHCISVILTGYHISVLKLSTLVRERISIELLEDTLNLFENVYKFIQSPLEMGMWFL